MVHVGVVLFRRLLHNSALIRVALLGQNLDWFKSRSCPPTHVNSGHFAVSKYAQNVLLDSAIAIDQHCRLGLADCGRSHSFARKFGRFARFHASAFDFLLGMCLLFNCDHVHGRLRRHLLHNGAWPRLHSALHPDWFGKLIRRLPNIYHYITLLPSSHLKSNHLVSSLFIFCRCESSLVDSFFLSGLSDTFPSQ